MTTVLSAIIVGMLTRGFIYDLNWKRSIALMVILLVLPVLSSCATSQKKQNEAEAQYKLGVSELRRGNTQAAFIKFQEAVRLDPRNKEIHLALGDVYIRLKELDKADEQFKIAIDIDKSYSEAYNFLCYLDYTRKRYDTALMYCNKALENVLYATPELAYYNMGKVYHAQRKFDKAIESYKNALLRNPVYFQGYYALALAYDASKMYGPAAEAMNNAITFDPRFHGDRVKAEKEFRRLRSTSENPKEYQSYIDILHY